MGTRLHGSTVAMVGVAGLLLAGCGSDSGNETTASDLNGSTFTSTSVDGSHEMVEGSTITLAFEDDNLSAQAGCNTMTAAYTIDKDLLKWSGDVASTRMACSDDLTAQDEWLTGILTEGADVDLNGDKLILTHEDDTIELTKAGD
jgi:heat shock protein HslJ